MNSVCFKPPEGDSKTQSDRFSLQSCSLLGKKSATKFLYAKTASDNVVSHSLAYLTVHVWLVGDVPNPYLYEIFRVKDLPPCKNDYFQSIFAGSTSAITLTETSSIMTSGKSTTCFPVRKYLDALHNRGLRHIKMRLHEMHRNSWQKLLATSSAAIAERQRCRMGQLWPKVEDAILQTIYM